MDLQSTYLETAWLFTPTPNVHTQINHKNVVSEVPSLLLNACSISVWKGKKIQKKVIICVTTGYNPITVGP